MLKQLAFVFPVLISFALVSGCATRSTATVTPGTDMAVLKKFYVVQAPKDKRGTENLIRDNLRKRGFTAAAGPELSSYEADAVITYVDRWMWDITMYMVELTVAVRNPANNFPLASGNAFYTSLVRKTPEEMVDEVLNNIFKSKP